ncbi:hypothetical protein F4780DRAFT_611015 [Xylariomycetidae sp. FL0641]|nr:hypothetical protein F4780DRAFT_611015 [Xylariomycetidae sp. FL0641]
MHDLCPRYKMLVRLLVLCNSVAIESSALPLNGRRDVSAPCRFLCSWVPGSCGCSLHPTTVAVPSSLRGEMQVYNARRCSLMPMLKPERNDGVPDPCLGR